VRFATSPEFPGLHFSEALRQSPTVHKTSRGVKRTAALNNAFSGKVHSLQFANKKNVLLFFRRLYCIGIAKLRENRVPGGGVSAFSSFLRESANIIPLSSINRAESIAASVQLCDRLEFSDFQNK
jgi:hypothetical protein